MSFPRYEKYKNTGIECLAAIPEHWEVKPLLAIGRERDELNTGLQQTNLLSLSYGRIVRKDINTSEGLLPESFETYQTVYPGDIVFRLTDLQNDKRSLRTAIVQELGIITAAYLAFTPKHSIPEYLNYMLRTFDNRKVFYAMGSGVRQSMNFADIKRLQVAVPPLCEQKNIASFLDHETAKIDALIQEQQSLIELLKEKRQAVISHAVTKGLDPTVPMKDSGIEWIGLLPSKWRIGRCGRHIKLLSGFAFPSVNFSPDESHTKLLRGINVGAGYLRWGDTVYWQRADNDGLTDYELVPGDIVLGMDRPIVSDGVRVAKVAEDDLPCLLLQRVARIRTDAELNCGYLFGLLSCEMFEAHFAPETSGVSVPHISPEQIRDFVIPLPDPCEQQKIVEFAAQENARIRALTEECQTAIALLKERRAALISAAVTGKIDTRHYRPRATPTPEELYAPA